jgi:hypothetical protein
MYLVDYKLFSEFLSKKCIQDNAPLLEEIPAIIEYRKDNILLAKIEVVSMPELKHLRIYGGRQNKNKFWIRGNEWQLIDNQPLMKLEV